MTRPGVQRDVTIALQMVGEIHKRRRQHRSIKDPLDALTLLLMRMDARTGRRDPSWRKPARKVVAKKAARRKVK